MPKDRNEKGQYVKSADKGTQENESTEQSQSAEKKSGDESVGEHGFPVDTPIVEMTPDQQAAYWKHKARKWEDRARDRDDYDDMKKELETLRDQNRTDSEREVENARKEAAQEESARWAVKVAEANLRGALQGRGFQGDELEDQLSYVDFSKFLDNNGELDSDKVNRYLDTVAPNRHDGRWPDVGQGNRGGDNRRPGGSVEAGRQIHKQRNVSKNALEDRKVG